MTELRSPLRSPRAVLWDHARPFDPRSLHPEHHFMDSTTRANRMAWEAASEKHVREYEDLLAQAASGSSLIEAERLLLRDVLHREPDVVHHRQGRLDLDG